MGADSPPHSLCIYIYAVELLTGPSAFFKTLFVRKHYKIGVSAHVYKKKFARAIFQSY